MDLRRRVVVLDKVTDLLLFFGKLLVVGGIGVLAFFFFSGRLPGAGSTPPALHYYWLPIIVSAPGHGAPGGSLWGGLGSMGYGGSYGKI